MKTKIIAILVFASLMTKLNAQNHDKVGLLEKPVPVSSVRNITGFFGHRMEVNRNAYLKHFPIDKYVDFVVNRQHSAWDWTQAEQHGKWIESAYLSAVQGDDKELLIKAESVLNRIILTGSKRLCRSHSQEFPVSRKTSQRNGRLRIIFCFPCLYHSI